MSFIEDNLISDEEIIYQTEISWFIYLTSIIWAALAVLVFTYGKFALNMPSTFITIIALFLVIIAVVKFCNAFIHQACTEIGITNKRMVAKFGFIARETLEIPLNRIESVTIDQSVIERLTNCGTVAVHGTGQMLAPVKFIDSPLEFRNQLNEAIAEYKEELSE